MPLGSLSLILHAHLPYVRHPEHEHFLEERWLFEAITETYIPLIHVCERLLNDGVRCRLTMSLTPTLLSMLADPLLQERYWRHLNRLIELAERELDRTRWEPAFHGLAQMYRDRFLAARHCYGDRFGRDLIAAFRLLQDRGALELLTCAGTHGYLPLLDYQPAAVRAQVAVGVETHWKYLQRQPAGIWLPECGYQPGHDRWLREFGLRYFITDAHGILFGSPRPKYGVYAPAYCPSGVAAFGRDLESSKSVWSAKEGYPGDYHYREFYRDIGYDLEYDYIRPYLNGDGTRINTGIKYYRITGPTEHKEPYHPDWAREKAAEHAGNFLFNRTKQVEYLATLMDRPPLVVSPYDAELFGHWWFEGPEWLESLLRKLHYDQQTVALMTPGEYLTQQPRNQVLTPSLSSWGYQGYSEVWLNGANDWLYRHVHQAAERMTEAAQRHPHAEGALRDALNQMARELLLAQSSDWAFILKTGTHTDYARQRVVTHLSRFTQLYEAVCRNVINSEWVGHLAAQDNVFPTINYRLYDPAHVS